MPGGNFLEVQATFTGCIGESLDAAVIDERAAVEHGLTFRRES